MVKFLIPVAALFFVHSSLAGSIEFLKKSKSVKTVNIEKLKGEIKVHSITVVEPHLKKEVTYEGFETNQLLEHIYGKNWKRGDELLFTCVDGYQPSIPIAKFARHKSWLVFARGDKKDFTVNNPDKNNKKVELGPLYLVWDNLNDEQLKEANMLDWPYQVVKLDIIDFATKFPRLAPGKKATTKAREGFLHFRKHCIACHTINGEGGKGGKELNYPVSVTELYKEYWIRKWILNPKAIRYNTTMPPLRLKNPKTERVVVGEIFAYLKEMKGHKKTPPDVKSSPVMKKTGW